MATQLFGLEGFVRALEGWGLTDVMLPFLLVFTLLFAVLEKTKVLGDQKRNLNLTISLVISLLVVIPHVTNSYPGGMDVVDIMNKALPSVSIVIIAVIMLLILVGLFGQDKVFLGIAAPGWVSFISFMAILLIFGNAAGWWGGQWGDWMRNFFGHDAIAIIIMVLVFGLIIAFITGESKDREDLSMARRMGLDFSKVFGGGK